jgi:diguanylate cyclase (GGDEF)-like protein/PAS domain S-box-containing protein
VRAKAASIGNHPWLQRLRKHGLSLRLAQCFLFVTLATVFVRFAPDANHLLWFANGVLLAYLLLAPRKNWLAYMCAGFAAQAVGSVLVLPNWGMDFLLTVLNLAEVLISAILLRRSSVGLPRFTNRTYLIHFIMIAVLAAPLTIGLVYALISTIWLHTAFGSILLQWAVADGLGVCVATPACVAIFRTRFKQTLLLGRKWVYLLLIAAASFATFSHARGPLAFILYPLLVLVLLQLGIGWGAMATLFVAGVGSWFTVRGTGPFAASSSLDRLEPILVLQVYLASAMFMLYSVSVVLESRRATERRLQKIVLQHRLVTENSRDAIIMARFDGHRTYVSAAAETLSGWKPEEVMKQGTLEIVHPDDWPKVETVLHELRSGAEEAMVECRVRKRSGEYFWIEASLRVVHDPSTGLPSGILNVVRDITERKLAERQLKCAYHALEGLAITDGLTGLANRRRFDQCLTAEWRRGMRDRKPLSLLLIDADLFKSYNDTYGHLRGDGCLKQIAEAAMDVVARPGDVVARFGGEEFSIILPGTSNEGALRVANEICTALRSRKLVHRGNPLGIMTVSVGCATMIPQLGQDSSALIELADKAMYQAKRSGRNQVCNYRPATAALNESVGSKTA